MTDEDKLLIQQNVEEQLNYKLDSLIEDLKRKWDNENYFYDEIEARKFYKFVSKLQIDKGKKGEHIKLLKFQFITLTEILCVKHKDSGLRKHKECLLDISRKNSKGTIAALIIIYLYFTDSTFGAEYIIVANDKKQAGNLFNTINLMIRNNATLKKYVKITESTKQMYRKATNSYLRVLANDGTNLDSYATYIMVCDEAHEYRNSDAYTKLRTGMGLWKDPICLITTTASSGQEPHNLEFEFYNYAKNIEIGKFADSKFYSNIFEGKKNCKLTDVQEWINANPALGCFRQVDDLEDFLVKATRIKSFEAKARRLYLNQHVALDGENAINMADWRDCLQDIDINSLKGMSCWCGLDMAFIRDIIAYVQCFYDEDKDKFIIYPHLFTPKETLYERSERDSVRYDLYAKQKDLLLLNGYYVDNEELFNYIDDLNLKYKFDTKEIAFDRWGAGDIRSRLEKKYTVFGFGQGYKSMSPTIRDFEIMMLDKRLIIANNTLLTWMASNVVATEDPAGNIKYDKDKAKGKIDGIIALLMALSRARYNNCGNNYNALDALNAMDW
jgi:phage terminase large subunit-like protein